MLKVTCLSLCLQQAWAHSGLSHNQHPISVHWIESKPALSFYGWRDRNPGESQSNRTRVSFKVFPLLVQNSPPWPTCWLSCILWMLNLFWWWIIQYFIIPWNRYQGPGYSFIYVKYYMLYLKSLHFEDPHIFFKNIIYLAASGLGCDMLLQ